uniref:Endonuclease/exonuclease/phosphatase domain-containing protein n=1 Tax=Lotharella globosa TaxID=91324 RepID=A0A6U3BJL7_9EUKA|mmetsp:Transcript_31501/g.61654  ORF Transcript_31501/g.61654 Transcript_31501/m.61654 type:complete len:343 (+) Transcript_31501:18-1046(+)
MAGSRKRKDSSGAGDAKRPGASSKKKAKVIKRQSSKPTSYNLEGISNDNEGLRIVTWNVNGLKGVLDQHEDLLIDYVKREDPDIMCIQETKVQVDNKKELQQRMEELVSGYHYTWNCCSTKKGYAGTLIMAKVEPLSITCDDVVGSEGRLIVAEYAKAYIVTTYVPNSGLKLDRLRYRTEEWDLKMREKLDALKQMKPVIWCGDLNVAHGDEDVADWKKKRNKSPGFCDGERENFGLIVGGDGEEISDEQRKKRTLPLGRPGPAAGMGFVDAWREFQKDSEGYTFWSYRFQGRPKNNGWRLDYFVVSKEFLDNVMNCTRRNEMWGPSDHIPLVLNLKKGSLF